MLCWAHSALIGQQLSASHVLLQLSNLCQAFSKKFKVVNTRDFSLLPGLNSVLNVKALVDAFNQEKALEGRE